MRKEWIVCILFSLSLYLGCSTDGKGSKIFNPNGDSELALLMRDMYDDGMVTKQEMLQGKQPDVRVKYHQLHTAKATDPEKVAAPNYNAFALAYEDACLLYTSDAADERSSVDL